MKVSLMLSTFLLFFQSTSLDPGSFTEYGIVGILGVVILILGYILYKLFYQHTKVLENRDKMVMDFVNDHRSETTAAMMNVASTIAVSQKEAADKVAGSYDRLQASFERQARVLDEVVLSSRVVDRIAAQKRKGVDLTDDEIERAVRTIMHERSTRGG